MRAGDPRGGGEDSGGGAGGLLESAARPAAAPHQVPVFSGPRLVVGGWRRCRYSEAWCVDTVWRLQTGLGWDHANIYCLTSNTGCVQSDAGDGGPGN